MVCVLTEMFLNLQTYKMKRNGKKGNRVQVILECRVQKFWSTRASRYITTKNKKNTPDRMELKKYNPVLKKMTVHQKLNK